MSVPWVEMCRLVFSRAANRCEYCRMHQSLQGATFHVEHIIPRVAGGGDGDGNLCLACPSCNLHKSSRTSSTDSETESVIPLFNPRTENWADHFEWHGSEILGRTPSGRATAALLDMNAPRRLLIREAEAMFDLFPPG